MDFEYTETQEQIKILARDFAEKEVKAGAAERDRTRTFDHSLLRKMGDLGLCGILYPEDYGGANGDLLSFSLLLEEIARVDYSFAYEVPGTVNPLILMRASNEDQKLRWRSWAERGVRGEITGSLAVTEPVGGSNISAIQTTAIVDDDHWVLNGTKCFISHVGQNNCLYVMVLAITDRARNEYNLIVVPKGTAGFEVGQRYNLIGIRSIWNGEVSFQDCRVPLDYQVWKRGMGREAVANFFKMMSPVRAGGEIGLQQACFDEALRYAKERIAFSRPIGKFQHIQEMLVEMETNLEISRLLRNKAIRSLDLGKSTQLERSRLKWFVCESTVKAAKNAVEIFGGSGLNEDLPIARYYRDARVCTIPGGTTEIHKWNMARELGL